MANNPILFDAAVSGAFGGINTGRTLVSSVQSSYSVALASAVAFATAVDAGIAANLSFNQVDADLMRSICQQVLSGKGAAGKTAETIAAVVAAFTAAQAGLVSALRPSPAALNYDGSVTPLVITALAAGHTPGNYALFFSIFRKVVAGAGSVGVTHSWSYPVVGATTFARGNLLLTALGTLVSAPLLIQSNGVDPIISTLTNVGITGSPSVDIVSYAQLLSAPA